MDGWIETVRVALGDNATPDERVAGAEALGWIALTLSFSGTPSDDASLHTPEAIADLSREEAISWLLHRLCGVLESPQNPREEEA